jgi:hypothetical protein
MKCDSPFCTKEAELWYKFNNTNINKKYKYVKSCYYHHEIIESVLGNLINHPEFAIQILTEKEYLYLKLLD